ncbi:hypothetical protein [Sphingobium limneticum]|uniref:RNA helicase n=1 Tax=Sphingobium limneticum TaxID=1007511 RepID=A0A5J5I3S7_9SPHN|nr:hypothetical protein [Sphingobium limneticum]KAA9018271.1 hypothetical protein F4U96_09170 [Sphingobium limneticum]KAA9030907.1 hypothetical protein F4U95_09120 [Sphingobium limneticum]
MAKAPTAEAATEAKPVCGIIMPIAAMPPKYDAAHWIDVRRVIDAAIIKADMTPQIVSDSFEGDVIQRRIINNLYDNPVVVCDVSGVNPNVMFELGMRITFKQPVVIITDDYDTIPFDTKVIEHLGYPRDLHIHHTTDFIEKLADRIQRLHEQKKSDTFTSFIEEFGTFEVLEPTKKVVPAEQLILDRLTQIEARLSRPSEIEMMREINRRAHGAVLKNDELVEYNFVFKPSTTMDQVKELSDHFHRRYRCNAGVINTRNGNLMLEVKLDPSYSFDVKTTETLLNAMPAHLREIIEKVEMTIS